VLELGQFVPQRRACEKLSAGQVGYLVCNIKDVKQVHIGDTITIPGDHAASPMPGYKPPQRMVYCGLYPSEGENFEELRDALEKLSINDPSFEYAPESSEALGFGFRCGFLGLLHMEIIQQRLEKEHDLDLVQTAPNVTYRIKKTTGETIDISSRSCGRTSSCRWSRLARSCSSAPIAAAPTSRRSTSPRPGRCSPLTCRSAR
jgi:GTP-binding protein LepA